VVGKKLIGSNELQGGRLARHEGDKPYNLGGRGGGGKGEGGREKGKGGRCADRGNTARVTSS